MSSAWDELERLSHRLRRTYIGKTWSDLAAGMRGIHATMTPAPRRRQAGPSPAQLRAKRNRAKRRS